MLQHIAPKGFLVIFYAKIGFSSGLKYVLLFNGLEGRFRPVWGLEMEFHVDLRLIRADFGATWAGGARGCRSGCLPDLAAHGARARSGWLR